MLLKDGKTSCDICNYIFLLIQEFNRGFLVDVPRSGLVYFDNSVY